MVKHRRKPSAAQRDKFSIGLAKILKRKGVISKQAKLHGGKYLSRSVLKKVREFQHVATDDYYRPVKVSPKLAKQAREAGYQVTNSRIIAPNDNAWIARIKRGILGGIQRVKGGHIESVEIDFTAANIGELTHEIETTNLENLKLEDELFAFTFFGNMSHKGFHSAEQMREYLKYYDPEKTIKGIKFYRLRREDHDMFILGPQRRAKLNPKNFVKRGRSGEGESRIQRLDRLNPTKAAKVRKKWAEKAQTKREKIAANPAKYEAEKAKARERMRRNRGK